MLAAVLTMFLVFTMSGVAVLNLSSYTALENQDAVQSLQNQYYVESAVNVAMWKINAVGDDFGSYDDKGVTVAYDTTTNELIASIDRFDKTYEIAMDLSDDDHFNHGLSTSGGVVDNGNSVDESQRQFNFLPDVDMDYLTANAVATHSGYFTKFTDADVSSDGIHIFTGSFIEIEDVQVTGTLVFTGRMIFFDGDLHVTADTASGMPAIVFSNSQAVVMFHENEADDDIVVNGPVYSAGKIFMRDGEFSGPIIGKVIELENSFSFNKTHHHKYYSWKQGFGNRSSYDWPKHIGRWRVITDA